MENNVNSTNQEDRSSRLFCGPQTVNMCLGVSMYPRKGTHSLDKSC